MKEKYRYLSKNVLLFSLSGFVPKILSFILIPIYTGYLSTSEYGISDLINTTVMLLVPIFTLDIQDAVMRFALDKNYLDRDVFSTGIHIILRGGSLVAAVCALAACLHLPGVKNVYLVFIVIMFFTMSCNNTFSLFCRGIDKVKIIAVGSIINSVITLSANILFLVFFHWKLIGYLTANTVGALFSLTYIFFRAPLYPYIHFHLSASIRKDMVAFSFPLIFSVVAWWVNNASDRYILSWMAGVSVSGVYAIAYKIPNIMTAFQDVFAQAWSISAVKEFDKNDSDGFIGRIYQLMNFAMAFLCSGIMLMNMPIAYLLYSNKFFEAWRYVPPLLLSVLFNAMSLFIGSIFTAVKDTRTLAISTVAGAVINTVCNFVLIYFWQAYGAAMATLIGYFTVFVMRHVILRKYICIRINHRLNVITYLLLVLQMVISYWGWVSIPFQAVILLLIFLPHKCEVGTLLAALRKKIMQRACK